MKLNKSNLNVEQELVPPMPEAFSEAVDKAVFTAIRQENEQKQEIKKADDRAVNKKKLRRWGTAAAAAILLLAAVFTAGLGIFNRNQGQAASSPKYTVDTGEWDGDLYNIPLYSNPAPEAVRYDLTEGYAYADELLDLVQEDLRWLNENDYDELWLLAVNDLSTADFTNIQGTGETDSQWQNKQNRLFALVQYAFAEKEGPMLVECQLDETGKPVNTTIKVLSCDPELDGGFSYNQEDYVSPSAYVLYGTGTRSGQLSFGDYTLNFTSALPLNEVQEKLANTAHPEHAREWYLCLAPVRPTLRLYTPAGEEKAVQEGPAITQTRNFSSDIGLRMTMDGEVQYSAGRTVPEGMDEEELEKWLTSYTQSLSWAFEKDDSKTFFVGISNWEPHSMVLETNLPNLKTKKILAYNALNGTWYESTPATTEELMCFSQEPGENVYCLYGESEGQEYVMGFSVAYWTPSTYDATIQYPQVTMKAKRYDLTGGYEHFDALLDEVENYLQAQGTEYDELWLEAVYELEKVDYTLLGRQYGKHLWMTNYRHGYALVQYDFSEGAGPMLVFFDYGGRKSTFRFDVEKREVDPNVDMLYGSTEGEDPYEVPYKYKCMGTGARSGRILMDKAVLKFTSQLPLEEVQKLVQDSPYKDAAREWYFCLAPAIGEVTLYDENGQERELRSGYALYGEEAYEKTWEGYCADFNVYTEEFIW